MKQSLSKQLHIQPSQFDELLLCLEAKTPPKIQTMFSVRQLVSRLYEFITQSLERHYSFDDIAMLIQTSLVEVQIVQTKLDLKGETLKKYYSEIKRERSSQLIGKRKSTVPHHSHRQLEKGAPIPEAEKVVRMSRKALPQPSEPVVKPTATKKQTAQRSVKSKSAKAKTG